MRRSVLATLSASLRARNADVLALAMDAVHDRQQARARAHGETWEAWLEGQHAEALRLGIVVRLQHCGPAVRCVWTRRGQTWVPVEKGPPDYLGTLADGRSLVVEAKHLDAGRLYLDPPLAGHDRQTIPAHQRAYLDDVAGTAAVVLLVCELGAVRASIPWRDVPWRIAGRTRRRSIGAADVARWTCRGRCYLEAFVRTGAAEREAGRWPG